MHSLQRTLACALAGAMIATAAAAAPPFEVAYRAWEVVTGIARHDRNPALAGDCGKSFQAAAVPGLRRQTQAQQDAAAEACHRQARALCANRAPRTPAIDGKCEEFR